MESRLAQQHGHPLQQVLSRMEWKKERGRSPASTGDAEDAEPHWGTASTGDREERHGPQPPQ